MVYSCALKIVRTKFKNSPAWTARMNRGANMRKEYIMGRNASYFSRMKCGKRLKRSVKAELPPGQVTVGLWHKPQRDLLIPMQQATPS